MVRTTRRALLRAAGAAVTGTAVTIAGCLGGGDSPDGATTTSTMPPATTAAGDEFAFETSAFADGATIPGEYTCDGANRSPPLSVSPPDGTGSLALVVDDPDAPGGVYTHWLCWNVPADTTDIPAGIPAGETVSELGGARQGTNDSDRVGYSGPCPPSDDDAHTYRFTAHAVDRPLDLAAGARKDALLDALDGPTIARSRFTGEYERA